MTSEELPNRTLWDVLKSCAGTPQDQRNSIRFALWCLAWALTYVVAHKTINANPDLATAWVVLGIAAPICLMIVAVFSYAQFLRNADELLQKIQLQGLALGFGAGIVFITGYQLAEAAGASEMETDHAIVVMLVSWYVGQLYGAWRYR